MGIEVSLSAVAYLLMVSEIMHAGPQVSSVTGRSCVHSSPGLSDSQEQNSPLRKTILSQIIKPQKEAFLYLPAQLYQYLSMNISKKGLSSYLLRYVFIRPNFQTDFSKNNAIYLIIKIE